MIEFSRISYPALRGNEWRSETNDCTVVALSIAADLSYAEAHKVMAYAGRLEDVGSNLLAGLRRAQSLKLLSYDVRNSATKEGRYIVGVPRHAFALVDGVIYDHNRPSLERVDIVVQVQFDPLERLANQIRNRWVSEKVQSRAY